MEEKLNSTNVELVTITPFTEPNGYLSGKFHRFTKEELEVLLTDL